MRVLLVDDHPLFRQALAATIARLRPDAIIEEFDTVAGAREAMCADDIGALILLDIKLPDNVGMTGLLLLKAAFPDTAIAVVSASDDPETIQTVSVCGASGFISKTADFTQLSAAVETLLRGEEWFPNLPRANHALSLSAMQTRILNGVKRGLMNKQIAFEIGISEHTVKYHLSGIFRQLGCQTRAQLLALSSDRLPSI